MAEKFYHRLLNEVVWPISDLISRRKSEWKKNDFHTLISRKNSVFFLIWPTLALSWLGSATFHLLLGSSSRKDFTPRSKSDHRENDPNHVVLPLIDLINLVQQQISFNFFPEKEFILGLALYKKCLAVNKLERIFCYLDFTWNQFCRKLQLLQF